MSLFCQFNVRGRQMLRFAAVALTAVAGIGGAQAPSSHRWAAVVNVDAGSMPDDFGDACALVSGRAGGAGGGVGVLFRPRPWLVTKVDTRATVGLSLTGCKTLIPLTQIGPNQFELWAPRTYPNGGATEPLVRSAVHVGVETPGGPLLRATVGAGMIWTGRNVPYGSFAIGGGSRGRGSRFYWELEANLSRPAVREVHGRFQLDSAGQQIPLPSRIASYHAYMGWTMLHLGVEIPIA
jgi:hypothetical protein